MIEISLNQLLDNGPDEPGPRESKGSSGKSIKDSFRRPGCGRDSAEPKVEFHCVMGEVTSITSQSELKLVYSILDDVLNVDRQLAQCATRQPAPARFVPRKPRAVKQDDASAGLGEPVRAVDVNVLHSGDFCPLTNCQEALAWRALPLA